MLEHTFVHTAIKLNYTTDKYGQRVLASTLSIPCRFREDASIVENNQMQQVICSAMAHFPYNSGVKENDLLLIEGNYYTVIKVIYGRRIGSPGVQFVKTLLQRNIEAVS